MGGKMSTCQENRLKSVTPTYNKPNDHWSNRYVPETRTPIAPPNNYILPSTNMAPPSFPATTPVMNGGGFGGLPSKAANPKEIIVFHSSTKWREFFQASKQSNKLVVIYFTATWCGPCKSMEPTIKELVAKYTNVDIVKIDVDELFNVSRDYGIQTMPSFVFMKNGKEIDKVIGAKKEELQRKFESHSA